MQKEKGITLIALIITIIVMLVLVGVSISVSLNGGLFKTAKQAKEGTQIASQKEQLYSAAIGAIEKNAEVNYNKLNRNLPEGFRVENGIYISKDGNRYSIETNGNVQYVETLEELKAKHTFSYYSTLGGAITDVNNGTIGENADVDEEQAVAGIYTTQNDKTGILLLKDATETTRMTISADVMINLGGNTLTIDNNNAMVFNITQGDLVIDGRINGSEIKLVDGCTATGRFIQVANENSSLTINGGTYEMKTGSTAKGTAFIFSSKGIVNVLNCNIINEFNSNNSVVAINCKTGYISNSSINIENSGTGLVFGIKNGTKATIANSSIDANGAGEVQGLMNDESSVATLSNININAKSTGCGKVGGVVNHDDAYITIFDSNIYAESSAIGVTERADNYGFFNYDATAEITNTIIVADAPYLKNDDTILNTAIGLGNSYGIVKLNNCNIKGVLTGIITWGPIYVDGGTYEGILNGGILFVGSSTTSYVKNSSIRQCDNYSKFNDDLTTEIVQVGLVIGGKNSCNNIIVYVDNCNIYGEKEPILLQAKLEENNNSLYISNSSVNKGTELKIRVDSSTHRVYIGRGNNFGIEEINPYEESGKITAEDLNTVVIITEEVYCQ